MWNIVHTLYGLLIKCFLSITAHGCYCLSLNGKGKCEEVLKQYILPGQRIKAYGTFETWQWVHDYFFYIPAFFNLIIKSCLDLLSLHFKTIFFVINITNCIITHKSEINIPCWILCSVHCTDFVSGGGPSSCYLCSEAWPVLLYRWHCNWSPCFSSRLLAVYTEILLLSVSLVWHLCKL